MDLWTRTLSDEQAAITAVAAALERPIADPEARLGRDFSDSSKPPSSDPIPVDRRPLSEPSGRERGGQPGHRRHTRAVVPPERLSAVVKCKPTACRRCGGPLGGTDSDPTRHPVAEIPEVDFPTNGERRDQSVSPRRGGQ